MPTGGGKTIAGSSSLLAGSSMTLTGSSSSMTTGNSKKQAGSNSTRIIRGCKYSWSEQFFFSLSAPLNWKYNVLCLGDVSVHL
jgi:hypothetical protein